VTAAPSTSGRTTTQDPPTTATVCIAGCGPAGAMLALLLARAGVDVVVLEKHADFHRDFRGDTIHASTLQVLDELGLLAGFDRLPQQRTTGFTLVTDSGTLTLGDFTRLPGRFQALSMVPQWDFLDFLVAEARRHPSFRLLRQAEVVGLVEEGGRVLGVRYRDRGDHAAGEEREVRAMLTVAADGRHSAVRRAARLARVEFGAPMDVLWYRLPKAPGDPPATFARLTGSRFLPMIHRGGYWQGAYTMPKGAYAGLRAAGIEACAPTSEPRCRSSPTGSTVRCATGTTRASSRCGSTGCAGGTDQGCCASATPHTRCPPSAASGSTWRSRTRSRPPTCSRSPCFAARSTSATWPACSAAVPCRPA
jgi:2-polyprenyl-6-methoxyphenol hydroxylase-like FAD-dependent oxidoreductase